jgi:hypothetical protein
MLQGDQSNAPLFIAGCGLATLAIALTQGWRHKALMGSLFLISVALGACAMTWGYFEAGQPQIAGTVSAVAGRSASWVCTVGFLLWNNFHPRGWFGVHREPWRKKPNREDDL